MDGRGDAGAMVTPPLSLIHLYAAVCRFLKSLTISVSVAVAVAVSVAVSVSALVPVCEVVPVCEAYDLWHIALFRMLVGAWVGGGNRSWREEIPLTTKISQVEKGIPDVELPFKCI